MKLLDIQTGYTIKVNSPDGTLFVHCLENEHGELAQIKINIGKSGSSVLAWADSLSRMISSRLPTEDIFPIITELSNITTDKFIKNLNGITIRSGPDAVFYALLLYSQYKNSQEPQKKYSTYRPPTARIPLHW